jgi:hypothetical protein
MVSKMSGRLSAKTRNNNLFISEEVMKVNTDKIEHILRTKYGWERFPLDEDLTKPKKKQRRIHLLGSRKTKC